MPQTTAETIMVGAITIRFVVDPEASGGSVSMLECHVPQGARVPAPHSHDAFDETIYGLSGVTTFTVDGVDTALAAGDAVFVPRGAVHGFRADAGDASFLAVASPGVFEPAYFREIGALLADAAAAGGPPDMGAMAAAMSRHGLTPAAPPPAA